MRRVRTQTESLARQVMQSNIAFNLGPNQLTISMWPRCHIIYHLVSVHAFLLMVQISFKSSASAPQSPWIMEADSALFSILEDVFTGMGQITYHPDARRKVRLYCENLSCGSHPLASSNSPCLAIDTRSVTASNWLNHTMNVTAAYCAAGSDIKYKDSPYKL